MMCWFKLGVNRKGHGEGAKDTEILKSRFAGFEILRNSKLVYNPILKPKINCGIKSKAKSIRG